jgi:hypothetical protein
MKLSSVNVTFSFDGEPTVKVEVLESHTGEFAELKNVTFDGQRIENIKAVMKRLWSEVRSGLT